MIEDGIGYCAPFRSLRLTPAPSARRRGTSKPSQEVVIQLFCFHYHSYKQVCRVIIKTKGVDFSTPSCFVFGWKMGREPTTLGTTILYSNQLSYIHHLDLISQIGCKYRVFIVSLQIYLQKFSENNRYPIYNYSQTTADGALPSHRSPSPAPQPYSHCRPAHLPPACCDHHPCNIPQ